MATGSDMINVAAIKTSVESVVESLVSRYEVHFDKERQPTEEHALNKIEIAENGPTFAKADKILKAAIKNILSSVSSFWVSCFSSPKGVNSIADLRINYNLKIFSQEIFS